eukprot:scaffold1402_cov254-Pinguiococcus_pyrenoidosus.AAC.35
MNDSAEVAYQLVCYVRSSVLGRGAHRNAVGERIGLHLQAIGLHAAEILVDRVKVLGPGEGLQDVVVGHHSGRDALLLHRPQRLQRISVFALLGQRVQLLVPLDDATVSKRVARALLGL